MKPTVYLADLRHDYGGVLSIDSMPLSVGYLKTVMDRDLPEVESRIFAYPSRLFDAMRENPPDILMVGNYCWNMELGLWALSVAKQINPNILTVMGGPNIPDDPDRRFAFVKENPQIDVYICNEADFAATDVARHFLNSNRSITELGNGEIASCIFRRPDGELTFGGSRDRLQNLNDIPSPWLTGVMDRFFDGKLNPMFETNRGCPFTCTFCVQGTKYYNRITNFELERLEEEVDYIGRRIAEHSPKVGTLRIVDANYGMYERDVTISGYIARAQKQYGWPTFIDATTGKNRAERIIRSMEQLGGALVLYQAVQSLDTDVLKNIKRSNIKLDAYRDIQVHMRGRGLRSTSDLILGLPGETLKSHTAGLLEMIDAGTDQMHCFQAMLLKGSDLESLDSRGDFTFDSRFRVLPKNFGVYEGGKVFDIEEIVVATNTLPFADYLEARKTHLAISVFWNNGWFRTAVDFAVSCGVKRSDWLVATRDALVSSNGAVRSFLDGFIAETENELFATREDCVAFYSRDDNFDRLRVGEIGDNLMYKYRALASFHLWSEICTCALDATRRVLESRGVAGEMADFDLFWSDLVRYCKMSHAHGTTKDEVLAPARAMFQYDIPRWLEGTDKTNTAAYRLKTPEEFNFRLSDDNARELRSAFEVWGEHLKGLTKMVTRIRVDSQVRECVPNAPASTSAPTPAPEATA